MGAFVAQKGGPGLFKSWITLSTGQITTQWIAWLVLLTLIHWIAISSLNSVIQRLNNWGLINIRIPGDALQRY